MNALGLDWRENLTQMQALTKKAFSVIPKVIKSGMTKARGFIDEAWKGIVRSSIGFINTLLEKGTEGIQALTNTFISGANALINRMNSLIQQFNNLTDSNIGTFGTLPKADFKAPQLDIPQSVRRRPSRRKETLEVKVTGRLEEENGEIVGLIDDRAQQKVSEQKKRDSSKALRNNPS